MRRVFASNLLLLLAINAIVKPLYLFGVDLGIQNTVGTEEYGLYATWFSFAFLFGAIYDLGLLRTNLGAQGSYRFNSVVSVVDRLLLILVLGALLLNPAWTDFISIELFFVAQIATLMLTIGVAIGGTDLEPGQRWWSTNSLEVKKLLFASLPYGLTLLLSTAFTRIDFMQPKS